MLDKLKEFRRINKIPVKEFLKIIGSEYDITYFRKEQGKSPFTLIEAYTMSKKYNIPIDFFIPNN